MKRHEWIIVLLVIPMAVWPAMVNAQEHMGQGQSLSRGSYGSGLAEDVLIQTDPETGSLIIITDEETNRHIGEIIKSLDRPIPQVLIKVLFLEVTHGKGLDLGVEASYTVNEARTGILSKPFRGRLADRRRFLSGDRGGSAGDDPGHRRR
jgi:type II secretory pathway component GspD/PulD (secretin)